MVDIGSGIPVVLVPGVQGRWEWMQPAVEALAREHRVISDSLPGDAGSLATLNAGGSFEIHTAWLDAVLDRAGLRRAALVGVSYGGLVALHYAATRPERTESLALVSTPSPRWKPGCRIDRYLSAPRLLAPVFALSSPCRLYPEIAAAFPQWSRRTQFAAGHLLRVTTHPFRPTCMAERVRLLKSVDFSADCRRVIVPTLVVTGEPRLDRVVAVDSTLDYTRSIDGAVHEQIPGTGHIGLVTRPERFSEIIGRFVRAHSSPLASPARSRVPLPA